MLALSRAGVGGGQALVDLETLLVEPSGRGQIALLDEDVAESVEADAARRLAGSVTLAPAVVRTGWWATLTTARKR